MSDEIKDHEVERAQKIMLGAFDKTFPITGLNKNDVTANRNYKILNKAQINMAAQAIAMNSALGTGSLETSIQKEMEKMVEAVIDCIRKTSQKGKANGTNNDKRFIK